MSSLGILGTGDLRSGRSKYPVAAGLIQQDRRRNRKSVPVGPNSENRMKNERILFRAKHSQLKFSIIQTLFQYG